MKDIGLIENAYVLVEGEKILDAGSMETFNIEAFESIKTIDCSGKTVLPGFVDSHTHFLFGGYRADEFKMRLEGRSYMDIMNAGGGIASSVEATRNASMDDLIKAGEERLNAMLSFGVTTVEGKSGYGLDAETEIKQLNVMRILDQHHEIDIVSTFLGPHSVPKEYKDRPEAFIDYMIDEVLEEVSDVFLAEFADIFCEANVFSVDQARRFLTAAKEKGLKLKIHADEIKQLGGAGLAAELGATSADHLLVASDEDIQKLASSNTVATLLPGTAFSLKEDYADARKMIEIGCAVALATDYNPGSCPTHSIPLIIALAALQMSMSIEEIITALTINGAAALGRADKIGSIEKGKQADLVILKYPSINFLPYNIGMNCVEQVMKKGKMVVKKLDS